MINLNRQFLLTNRFNVIFFTIAIFSFIIVLLRAKFAPFTHDETATFYYMVQNGHYMPYYAHLDTNNHILNSMLMHICYSLMGSSKFVLRIPNLIFFLIFIIGVFRTTQHLKTNFGKLFLVILFFLSYNWLTFFSVARGYGISFASIIMAVSLLLDYLKTDKIKYFIYFCFWMQLAMAASLILMPVFCLMLGLIVIHQLLNFNFFTTINIVNLVINSALIFYWVKFSMYLQSQNGLTHGVGDSYWQVTFVTLIYIVTGSWSQLLQAVIVCVSLVFIVAGFVDYIRIKLPIKKVLTHFHFFFLILFVAEVIAMYLMKKIIHVNYPEDRTAFFFYITFVLYLSFLIDSLNAAWLNYLSLFISVVVLIHFFVKLNFRKHELYIYDTFPPRFYEKLLAEQKTQQLPITIGGHWFREFIYGFMNYRSDGALNPMDSPALLHMNCDYLVAKAGEKPFYKRYYTEIDSEPDWGFRLLKRNEKIINKLELEIKDKHYQGEDEFYELLNDTNNTLFPNKNPIRIDFTFKATKVPVPFEAWLVVQIDSLNGNSFCFKRSVLNWIKLNYNDNKEHTYSVVTPSLPNNYRCFKAFLWNIKREKINITFTSVKMYQLYGTGINYVAPIYY